MHYSCLRAVLFFLFQELKIYSYRQKQTYAPELIQKKPKSVLNLAMLFHSTVSCRFEYMRANVITRVTYSLAARIDSS